MKHKPCEYCGSRFPHLKFADGCEWNTAQVNQALACGECGSVKWILLRNKEVECARCGKRKESINA